jgi:hypothetical protein
MPSEIRNICFLCVQMSVADKVADAIQNTYNTKWRRGSICTTICTFAAITDHYFLALWMKPLNNSLYNSGQQATASTVKTGSIVCTNCTGQNYGVWDGCMETTGENDDGKGIKMWTVDSQSNHALNFKSRIWTWLCRVLHTASLFQASWPSFEASWDPWDWTY